MFNRDDRDHTLERIRHLRPSVDLAGSDMAETMSGGHQRDVEGENIYLRQRNAQLEGDVVSLQSEVQRLRQMLDRMHDPKSRRPPHDPEIEDQNL